MGCHVVAYLLLSDGRDRLRGDHAVGCHVVGLGLALMLAYTYACNSQHSWAGSYCPPTPATIDFGVLLLFWVTTSSISFLAGKLIQVCCELSVLRTLI